jgi:hypothetical protein
VAIAERKCRQTLSRFLTLNARTVGLFRYFYELGWGGGKDISKDF